MKRRPVLYGILGTLLLLIVGLGLYLYSWVHSATSTFNAIAAATAAEDSTSARDSMPAEFARLFKTSYSIDTVSGVAAALRVDTAYRASAAHHAFGGRRVAIAVCGVDSRVGERTEHADANHVITIWLDSGMVDIVSIPRDTPADAGFGPGNRLNILANVRARKGREAWLHEVAGIAGIDSVNYYIDLGFAQARGLLELLGFRENSSDALRILRSRRAFASGDFQRCFNQGQFMRQMLLANIDRMGGIEGDLLLRAGLYLVNSNLTVDTLKAIVEQLRTTSLATRPQQVTVAIKPEYYAKMSVFNFRDSSVMGGLLARINDKATKLGISGSGNDSVMIAFRRNLSHLLASAAADTATAPERAIARLGRCFQQRIWWQIADPADRARTRSSIGMLLSAAYRRAGHGPEAQHVDDILRFEEGLAAGRQGADGIAAQHR